MCILILIIQQADVMKPYENGESKSISTKMNVSCNLFLCSYCWTLCSCKHLNLVSNEHFIALEWLFSHTGAAWPLGQLGEGMRSPINKGIKEIIRNPSQNHGSSKRKSSKKTKHQSSIVMLHHRFLSRVAMLTSLSLLQLARIGNYSKLSLISRLTLHLLG